MNTSDVLSHWQSFPLNNLWALKHTQRMSGNSLNPVRPTKPGWWCNNHQKYDFVNGKDCSIYYGKMFKTTSQPSIDGHFRGWISHKKGCETLNLAHLTYSSFKLAFPNYRILATIQKSVFNHLSLQVRVLRKSMVETMVLTSKYMGVLHIFVETNSGNISWF